MGKKIDISGLKTQANYAREYKGKSGRPVKKQYIWQLIDKKKLPTVEIDGVIFIDTNKIEGYEVPKEAQPVNKPDKKGFKAL